MKGILGDLFDFNRDGKLDAIESALELAFLDNLLEEKNRQSQNDDDEEWV